MRFNLSPRWFFAGIICGLALLSAFGSALSIKGLQDGFVRFHPFINIESSFFPTARTIERLVDHDTSMGDAITVVVGGSSVMYGVGQSAPLVWTRKLQDALGDGFRVLNLAQRGGGPQEFGNVAVERLMKSGRPVLYIADGRVDGFAEAFESGRYTRVMMQAWLRRDLLPWKPRDAALAFAFVSPIESFRREAWGAAFDYIFNYNDFWNWITYNHFGTLWNSFLVQDSYNPRSSFSDPELPPDQIKALLIARNTDQEVAALENSLYPPDASVWKEGDEAMKTTMPPALRNLTLAIVDTSNPYYLSRLSDADRTRYVQQASFFAAHLKSQGIREVSTELLNFTDEDFIDRVHMSVSGGDKLAGAVAPIVRKMATDLGYLK